METIQQQLNALQTSVKRQRLLNIALLGIIVAGGFIAAVRPAGDATFDTITCKGWKVVDSEGTVRMDALTKAEGSAGVGWFDKEGKQRISVLTFANGFAGVAWFDKVGNKQISVGTSAGGDASAVLSDNNGKPRIAASALGVGHAKVLLLDKDGKARIAAGTEVDGTVILPTKDLNSPQP